VLLGRLNRIYGPSKVVEPVQTNYRGKYGFILD